MGVNVFPAASGGASYSSQPPASASSVLLDGQLVTAGSISTTVTGTGAPWLLYANGAGTTTIAVGSDTYSVSAGSTVGTSAYTGSKSVSIATTVLSAFTASTLGGVGGVSVAYGTISSTPYFVAVPFNNSTARYSTNGTTWTASTMPSTKYWEFVIFGNGYFVAGAASATTGGAAYSTNGTTWTASNLPTSFSSVAGAYGLISSTNYYVLVSNGPTSSAAYSTNGTSWSSMTMPSSQNWVSVAYGTISSTPYFVAVAQGVNNAAYSTNGTTWTASTLPSVSSWISVCYGNGKFVVVSQNLQTAYSTNGTTWTASTLPSSGTSNDYWTSVTYGNGYFVAVQNGGSDNNIVVSTDGITWSLSSIISGNYEWNSICYGTVGLTPYFVAVASGPTNSAAYSTNPIGTALPVAYGIYNGATVRA